MAMEIESHLFPIPESGYSQSGYWDRLVPLSLFAFQIGITTAKGNLTHEQRGRGYYFFRNDYVPLPRPATFLAWNRLCRLGHPESKSFYVPFLPSLTQDDEVGSAISERGSKVHSLSRKSPLHLRDAKKRIHWGHVYLGNVTPDSALTGAVDRSNFSESLVTPSLDQAPETATESIRTRLEFIASHGILGLSGVNSALNLPPVRRLLFQFVSQVHAEAWAKAYADCWHLIRRDEGQIDADFKEMMQELLESKRKPADDSEAPSAEKSAGKKFSLSARFGNDISLDF